MTRTYATRSRATQRADTPENPELTGEPQGLFLPTNPERSVVSDTERDESPPAKPKRRSYSDVVAKRVEPSAEENHNNETPLALDEESDEFVTTQRELNPEQAEAVRSAVDGMDESERDLISRRNRAMRDEARAHEPLVKLGEGPSKDKGKGIDPRNWGNLDLSDNEDLNPTAQAKAYKALQKYQHEIRAIEQHGGGSFLPPAAHKPTDNANDVLLRELQVLKAENAKLKEKKLSKKHKKKARVQLPLVDPVSVSRGVAFQTATGNSQDASRAPILPSDQLPAESYLGRAFAAARPTNPSGSDDPSSSESSYSPDESSSSSSSSESDNSSSSESSNDPRSRKRSHRKKKNHRGNKRRSCLIKPTPPEPYDGRPDSQAFFRFMQEAKSFVEEGQVRRRHRVEKLARYLQGQAYTFFVRQVSFRASEWTMDAFFTALFDFCFPTNYVSKQRKHLRNLYQNDKTVKEYVSELIELFSIIGQTLERDRVNKLWFGLRASIQQDLWRDRRNPETSSWNEVVSAAEVIEIAQSVVVHRNGNSREPRDNRPRRNEGPSTSKPNGNKPKFNKGDQHSGNNQSNHGQSSKPKSNGRFGNKRPAFEKPAFEKPKLSEEEVKKLRSEGRCFRCQETGHVSRQCPQAHQVRGNASSRGPPGIPIHGVGFIEETEELHEAVDVDEDLDVLHLGSMGLAEDPDSPRTPTSPAEAGLISFYTTACENALNLDDTLCLPGDELFPPLGQFWDENRFSIIQISDEEVVIEDRLQTERYEYLPIRQLMNPRFRVIHWLAVRMAQRIHRPRRSVGQFLVSACIGDVLADMIGTALTTEAPYPENLRTNNDDFSLDLDRFNAKWDGDNDVVFVTDKLTGLIHALDWVNLQNPHFNIIGWFQKQTETAWLMCDENCEDADLGQFFTMAENGDDPELVEFILKLIDGFAEIDVPNTTVGEPCLEHLELFGQQVQAGTYAALQRNAAVTKDYSRMVPKPVTITVNVNGQPARALIDSGSLGDFISTNLVEQLGLKKIQLKNPLAVQLAVQGSRSKINYGCRAKINYQNIAEERYFDVINLSNYDLILGTPWLYQHQITFGINPVNVVVGSASSLPMKGAGVSTLSSRAMSLHEGNLEKVRKELREYAEPLCRTAEETPLPPLRAINHTIPLIDETKVYHWRPSRCPEPLREQWNAKRAAYVRTGRWKLSASGNAAPMLLIYKPGTSLLRCVTDLRERNANTRKMSSPLPLIEGICRDVARALYWTLMDGQNAYEQIRIIPEHVHRSAMTTPDGTMLSEVLQQGDCNGPATYQALMNHLFAPYIGVFMHVYLDDIIIFSNSLEDHVRHVKIVLDILRREKLYLSVKKLFFLCEEMKILGRIIDKDGIRMDPHKVDSIAKWKTPTNRNLLRGFLGAVGYLADDVARVRVPMGILSSLTGDTVPYRWEHTHQRAFEEIKRLVEAARNHHRKPLRYGKNEAPIWMVTDGCVTGIAGVVSQGPEWKTADIAAFYSAKLNSAQQNYAVHEIEMLAGIETMLRHRDILQGVKFQWLTDHKGLIHLLNQRNLTGRQARWLEKVSEFDFTPVYIAGSENVLSDALSRMYSNDAPGTERARSEYTYHDLADNDQLEERSVSVPVLTGMEGEMAAMSLDVQTPRYNLRTNRKLTEKGALLAGHAPTLPPIMEEGSARKASYKRKKGGVLGKEQNPELSAEATDEIVETNSEAHPETNERPNTDTRTNIVAPPSLLHVVAESPYGLNLEDILRFRYLEDPFYKAIIDKPKDYRNFKVTDGLVYLNEKERTVLCIPKITHEGRNLREIVIAEAHSLLAHLGTHKTVDYLRDSVWWKDIVADTRHYCESCVTCKRSKPNNQKPYGLLNPLPVASHPWEAIGIDFVGPLPESSDRDASYDSITVVIDLLTAMVHLVPSRTNYTAKNVAELVFSEVYKLHGLPKRIISDRDVLFTSHFWQHLHHLIGSKLHMSSAYHPESDGSTERANRTLTTMIRQCIHPTQKDWVSKLPAIEFAINLARSESTGFAPFFLNSGRMPRPFIWDAPKSSEFPGVRVFAQRLKYAVMSAHDSILAARVKQTRDANRHRRASPFTVNDLVYISTKNISFPRGLARKFVPKYIGPYKITRDFNNNTYQVELPARLRQRGVHNAFHASLLRVHVPNDDRLFPGRLDNQISEDEGVSEPEWAVNRILSHHGSRTEATFKIEWTSGDVTWLPYHQVSHLQALETYLEAVGVANIRNLPIGTDQPPTDDPQIFTGSITFAIEPKDRRTTIKTRAFTRKNRHHRKHPRSSPTPDRSLTSAEMPQSFLHHLRTNATTITQIDPSTSFATTYSLDQISEYIRFDRALRKGSVSIIDPVPGGYYEFSRVYNLEPEVLTKFSVFDESGAIVLHGPQYGLQAVIPDGTLDPTSNLNRDISKNNPRSKPYSKPTTRASPVDPPAAVASLPSITLTPQRRELLEDLFFEKLEREKRVKQRIAESIALRQTTKAKKRADKLAAQRERLRQERAPVASTDSSHPVEPTIASSSRMVLDDADAPASPQDGN
ncbi:hypothetical protein CCMSSC00406_0009355 [Pleurotus cornucopiae]|uniref:Uncharacterized protein n=1 Tax=Pleurotus cornucopiae TaxID=5321 RepID=A0ACB7ITD6_PLECO|nr:hypothetical protein CCMSSC00406_0009355 [Pleurotus cornucopiae]